MRWACHMAPPWARASGHVAEFGLELGAGAWLFVAHMRNAALDRNIWSVWSWERPAGERLLFAALTASGARRLAELWASTYEQG